LLSRKIAYGGVKKRQGLFLSWQVLRTRARRAGASPLPTFGFSDLLFVSDRQLRCDCAEVRRSSFIPALRKASTSLHKARLAQGALVLAVFTWGITLRLWDLTSVPLRVDEAESSINALTILDHGYPVDHYLGMPIYENTLTRPWPESAEYEFRDSSYSSRGMVIYHGWLPLYSIAASFKLAGIKPDRRTGRCCRTAKYGRGGWTSDFQGGGPFLVLSNRLHPCRARCRGFHEKRLSARTPLARLLAGSCRASPETRRLVSGKKPGRSHPAFHGARLRDFRLLRLLAHVLLPFREPSREKRAEG
jgi:hypothetical protein